MKFALLTVLIISIFSCTLKVDAVSVSAKAAVVINGDTAEVIYSHNSDARLPMASTTKIMTALLLCEQNTPKREITVTKEMVAVEGSSMGLLVGDKVTFRGLLYGMLLASGNDAANTAAIAIDGSVSAFVERMNDKAYELGLRNTHFETPSGLDGDEHYTTAYELALLAKYALSNEQFAMAAASQYETLYYGNPPYRRTLKNHNRLLSMYDGAMGVKTGFTEKSGRCLVSAAKRDGEFVIAVTLDAPDDWNDHKKLLDYGFNQIKQTVLSNGENFIVPCAENGKSLKASYDTITLNLKDSEGIQKRVSIPHFTYGDIKKGATIGKVEFYKNNECIYSTELIAQNSVKTDFDKLECLKNIFMSIFSYI